MKREKGRDAKKDTLHWQDGTAVVEIALQTPIHQCHWEPFFFFTWTFKSSTLIACLILKNEWLVQVNELKLSRTLHSLSNTHAHLVLLLLHFVPIIRIHIQYSKWGRKKHSMCSIIVSSISCILPSSTFLNTQYSIPIGDLKFYILAFLHVIRYLIHNCSYSSSRQTYLAACVYWHMCRDLWYITYNLVCVFEPKSLKSSIPFLVENE